MKFNQICALLLTGCFVLQTNIANSAEKIWHPINAGLENTTVKALAVDATNPNYMYASNEKQGYFYTRDGKHWQPGDSQFINRPIASIAVDPVQPWHVFMHVRDQGGNIYRSVDYGKTWQAARLINQITDEQTNFRIDLSTSFIFNPVYTNEIYAGGFFGDFWSSYDSGDTWTKIGRIGYDSNDLGPIESIAVNPNNPREIYAGKSSDPWSPFHLYKSTDDGATWSPVRFRFFEDSKIDHAISTVLFDAKNPKIIYVFLEDLNAAKIFKSVDKGEHWQFVSIIPHNPSVEAAVIDSNNDNIIYALTSNSFLFHGRENIVVSYDAGKTWMDFNNGLPRNSEHTLVASGRFLYAGIEKKGVYALQAN